MSEFDEVYSVRVAKGSVRLFINELLRIKWNNLNLVSFHATLNFVSSLQKWAANVPKRIFASVFAE